MSSDQPDGSGRAIGRSRGRARGNLNAESENGSSGPQSRGRGRGSSSQENGDSSQGRGVRRGMERGRATLDNVDEIDTRLRNLRFEAGLVGHWDGEKYVPPHRIGGTQPDQVMIDDNIDNVHGHDNCQVLAKTSGFHGPVKAKDMVPIKLQTNVWFLQNKPNWSLYSYRVDFRPELDDKRQKKYCIRQHADELGGAQKYVFDGTKLWTQNPVHALYDIDDDSENRTFRLDPVELQDGTEVKIRLK